MRVRCVGFNALVQLIGSLREPLYKQILVVCMLSKTELLSPAKSETKREVKKTELCLSVTPVELSFTGIIIQHSPFLPPLLYWLCG